MSVLGFPVPPPNNGDDFDATPITQDLNYLLQQLQAFDASNIVPGSLSSAAFDSDVSPHLRYADMFQSFITSGGFSSGFAVLAYSVPSISGAYFKSNGIRLPTVTGASFTAAINSDTYVYVNSSGQILTTGTVVANGAAQPALPTADSQWLQKVVSNGTTITSITDLRARGPISPLNTSNPYNFSVYRNAALTPGSGSVIPFDTKEFDTGGNVDIVTNKGRFTAPVDGDYRFDAQIRLIASATAQNLGVLLKKNGAAVKEGTMSVNMFNGATSIWAAEIGVKLRLAATDYVEVSLVSDGEVMAVTGGIDNWFQGELRSRG